MTVSLSYQAWTSSNYNWNASSGTGHAAYQINDLLKNWVLEVNNNPSNTDRRITIELDPTDTSVESQGGWILKVGSPVPDSDMYIQFVVNTASNISFTVGSQWVPGTTNSGYGYIQGSNAYDTSNVFYTTGYDVEYTVTSDTEDGQEFFVLGWRHNNNMSISDYLLLAKDTEGEWAVVYNDFGSIQGSYMMIDHTTPQRAYSALYEAVQAPYATGVFLPPYFYSNLTTAAPTSNSFYTTSFLINNQKLWRAASGTDYVFGRWAFWNVTEKIVNIARNLFVIVPS